MQEMKRRGGLRGGRGWRVGAWGVVLVMLGGCATPMAVRPRAYDLHARLDPAANTLDGRAVLHLTRLEDAPAPRGPVVVEFELNPALKVEGVQCDVAAVKRISTAKKKAKVKGHEGLMPTVHRVTLAEAVDDFTLTVDYAGRLYQDPSSGEKRGQIHNFAMSATVGSNGIYLSEGGYWYPSPVMDDDTPPESALADWRLVVEPVEDVEFAAGLEEAAPPAGEDVHCWKSARPVEGIVLTGGRRERLSETHDGVRFYALVDPAKEMLGRDMLECAKHCYDRYTPLVGPYPFSEFTMLESFFSSGFAFPGMTQLAPAILNAKRPYWRHGYLDHEFLHNWFGNGVYVDPGDGNWCEALTSCCANLFGYDLDGDQEGARTHRRNNCHFLSRMKPEKDKALNTFGKKDGAGRSIGYDKGSMVFRMLAFKIGEDAFWAGVRRFNSEWMGRFANWQTLQDCFQAETDQDLGRFFEQWVRTAGTPTLEIRSATYDAGSGELELDLTQGGTSFEIEVPVRIYHSEKQYRDVPVSISAAEEAVRVPVASAPAFVELDPDYHIFRRVPAYQILPTSGLTRYGKKLLVVQPDGELWDGYELVTSDFKEGNGADQTTIVRAADLTPDMLEDTGVLVLGSAVHHPVVQGLLEQVACPVSWTNAGFLAHGQSFNQPGQAVFTTMRRPDCPKRGVTVYYGNSARALANAGILGYYSNSLLVFDTAGPGGHQHGGMGMGMGSRVVYRQDLERRVLVKVETR